MGFRSTFVTQDYYIQWPEWFIAKYSDHVNFNDGKGCISSRQEKKSYGVFSELEDDIQKVLKEIESKLDGFILVWLHECGGITRVSISKDSITYREPDSWRNTDDITHDYCYGCSDER